MGFMSIDRLIARRRRHPTYIDLHALRRPCSRGRHEPDRGTVVVRRARTSDVPRIKELIDQYAGRILLRRTW